MACRRAISRLDPETGFINLLGHWAMDDCGRVINPLLVDEQVRGGIVQGIGAVLYEECIYDDAGNLVNGTMADYLVPMAAEMPDIYVDHVESPEATTQLGAKGIGEPGDRRHRRALGRRQRRAEAPRRRLRISPLRPSACLTHWRKHRHGRPAEFRFRRTRGDLIMTSDRLLVRGDRFTTTTAMFISRSVADILIEKARSPRSGRTWIAPAPEIVDARNRLVMPGLINAHYHSHDTLCRGLFEELPLELWLLYTLPLGANRSKEELRARTLVGALELIRCGITCVQDMLGLVPLDDANRPTS